MNISSGKTERFQWVVATMKGWRPHMEDFFFISPEESRFAVFDGHGGEDSAKFCSTNWSLPPGDPARSIPLSFLDLERKLYRRKTHSGTTAVCAVIRDNKLTVGSVGDSRAVLCRAGKTVALTQDHHPDRSDEKKRILEHGHQVINSRVDGYLGMSRALGDFRFKDATRPPNDQAVACLPEMFQVELGQDDHFILLATDGIWDCMTREQVVAFVYFGLVFKQTLEEIARDLLKECLSKDGEEPGTDNMTCMIIQLSPL